MEILALLGTPTVVADNSSANRGTGMFSVTAVTHSFDTSEAAKNQPGQMFNIVSAAPLGTDGWLNISHQITLLANAPTLNDDTYDRLVFGFRMVSKGGFRGDNGFIPYCQIIATQKPGTGISWYSLPLPLSQFLTGDEGQYFEIVIDFKTGLFEFHIDGFFAGRCRFPATQGLDPGYYVGFRFYQDQVQIPYTAPYITGHYRDVYLGGLAVGEVFEPLGDLVVKNLPTTGGTLNAFLTPAMLNTWAGSASTVLDQVGTKLYTQTFSDPTPLKTAYAITGICPGVTGLGYIEAGSNGAKIAQDIKVRALPNVRVLKIKPADIGNDLTVSFKIDP